jgi:aspartate aminotransferase-like enzyme
MWRFSPCGGLVMFSEASRKVIENTMSTRFAINLKKWLEIMETYEKGGHAYHTTIPTDAIFQFHASMKETEAFGFNKIKQAQEELGLKVRTIFDKQQFYSIASEGYKAPTMMVYYTDDVNPHNGKKFAAMGIQIASGVPLKFNKPENYRTFRIGLFGLNKLKNIDRTVKNLDNVLTKMF